MKKDLVIFATADWAERYWTNKQRMADHFNQLDFRVLFVESFGLRKPGANQKDLKRIWRRLWSSLRLVNQVKKNLWVLSPLVLPFWQNKLIVHFNYFLIKCQLKIFSWLHKFRYEIVWTYHPYIHPLLNTLDPSKVYFHVVDNLMAVPNVDVRSYESAQRQLLLNTDAIFVTSLPLKEWFETKLSAAVPVHYSPNVVDVTHFSSARSLTVLPHKLQGIPGPRLLYYGVLSDFKLNVELIIELARRRPDWNFIFIGEAREGQATSALQQLQTLSNVHFLGYCPHADLPNFLAGVDVGILPLNENDYTRYMFPMKFFEFIAAGVPVVATPIAGLDSYQHFFSSAKTVQQFETAISQQLQQREAVISVPELQAKYSWQARMQHVLEVINQ